MSEATLSCFSMVSQARLLLCYEWPSPHTSLDQSTMTVPKVWRSSVVSQPWLLLCSHHCLTPPQSFNCSYWCDVNHNCESFLDGQSTITITVLTVTIIWRFSVVSQPWLVLCWESPLSHFSVVCQPCLLLFWITSIWHLSVVSQPWPLLFWQSPSSDASLWSVNHACYCADSHHCLTSL